MRIVATRPDGALHVSLDGGLSVILLGERSSNCAESSVIEAMGPWTEADNSLAARRAVAKRLDSARTSPLAAMSLVDAPPPPVSADALTAKAADHQRIAWADDNNVEKIAEAATEQAKEAMAMSGKAKTAEEHRKAAEALDAAAAAMVEVEKLRAPAPTPAIAAAAKMIVAGQAAPKVAAPVVAAPAPDPAAAQARALSETIDALDAVRTKLLDQINLVGQGRGWHADSENPHVAGATAGGGGDADERAPNTAMKDGGGAHAKSVLGKTGVIHEDGVSEWSKSGGYAESKFAAVEGKLKAAGFEPESRGIGSASFVHPDGSTATLESEFGPTARGNFHVIRITAPGKG